MECTALVLKTSSLCDYSDAYLLLKGTLTVWNTGTAATPNNRNKKVIFKNCAPFTDWISEINNKETDHSSLGSSSCFILIDHFSLMQ